MGKLVLSRRVGERIAIDETTFVSVERIRGDYVRLGFEAPRHVRIVRDELERIDVAKSMARGSVNLSHMTRSQHADIARLAGLMKNWMDNSLGVAERDRAVAKPLFDALNLDVDDYI